MSTKGLVAAAAGFAFGVVATTVGLGAALLCVALAGCGYAAAVHGDRGALAIRRRLASWRTAQAPRTARPVRAQPPRAPRPAPHEDGAAYGW